MSTLQNKTTPQRPITLLVCALGGEGGGVLAQWLVETALHCGHSAQASSIPGVAQRTGATTYYIEVFPRPDSELGGRKPIFSLAPVPGALDVLVSSELLETVRQVGNGMASSDRTQIISSRERTLTTAERLQPGDGRADAAQLAAVLHTHGREVHLFDMTAAALEAGTVMSAVLFGAIAAAGVLPFAREVYEAVIRSGGRGAEASLRGFGRAFDIVAASRGRGVMTVAPGPAVVAGESAADDVDDGAPASPAALAPAVAQTFPAPTHRMLGLGIARLVDYQDSAYAKLYVERLGRVLQAEQAADPAGAHAFAATQSAARYLALWMAFDDVVRVADLKTRRSRFERVRRETKARDDELLRVYEHFKPGIPEVAAMLPAGLGNRIKRWDVKRQQTGKPPVEFPLKIGTHTVFGFLALRMLAAVKPLRRHGTRFAAEQAFIERWLDAVVAGLRSDWSLGHEIAECGRLIKGYGSTNERGKGHMLHVIDHLASDAKTGAPAERAQAIRALRTAALSDASGKALDKTLREHGAPPRPIAPQPIRWVRKRPGARSTGAG
ncbi:MAG TPA: indolepyruvate oxidoreductase subunit beta family protein [Burkholderiaceae bacterium]|nr:indolepyruvate oxidoreductase subunit beta family protein [Burkholderiaceae bacterium]